MAYRKVFGVRMFVCVIVLMALVSAAMAACREEMVDVNNCGPYPPGLGCILINYQDELRECCSTTERQAVMKSWYDCAGDPTADCEYQDWFPHGDPSCSP